MEKSILIKKCFKTLQGEGPNVGKPCIFIRTVGCNSWDGKEDTKADSPCYFCDTDFVRDELSFFVTSPKDLLHSLDFILEGQISSSLGVVITGGEPLLQFDTRWINYIAEQFAWVDVETNGTVPITGSLLNNVCIICSPKFGEIKITPSVWKILYPDKIEYLEVARKSKAPIYIQPTEVLKDRPATEENIKKATELCISSEDLRLCLQIHKIAGIE